MADIVGLLMDRERRIFKEKGIKPADGLNLLCVLTYIYLVSFLLRSLLFEIMAKWLNRQKKKFGIETIHFDREGLAKAVVIYRDALQLAQELQRRINGESQPFEGIRIVRERKKVEDAPATM